MSETRVGPSPEVRDPPSGQAWWAGALAVVGLPLAVVPGVTDFLAVKRPLFLLLPALLVLPAPLAAGRAMLRQLLSLPGLLGLAVIALVAWRETVEGAPCRYDPTLFLGVGWVVLAWLRGLSEDELDDLVGYPLALAVIGAGAVGTAQLVDLPELAFLRLDAVDLPAGTLGNKDALAYFLALALPEVLAFSTRSSGIANAVAYLALACAVPPLVGSGCRGAWLGLALAGWVRWSLPAAVTEEARTRIRLGLGLALGLLLPVGLWSGRHVLEPLFAEGKAATLAIRTFTWERTVEGLVSGPTWGPGPGMFSRSFPALVEGHLRRLDEPALLEAARAVRVARSAHNDLLQAAFELGSAGTVVLAAVLGGGYLALGFALAATPGPGNRRRRRIGYCVLAVGTVAIGFHPVSEDPVLALALLLGLARSLGAQPRSDGGRLLGLVLILPVVGLATSRAVQRIQAEAGLAAGLEELRAGRLEAARDRLAASMILFPQARTANALGRVEDRRGRVSDAGDQFEIAERLDPSYAHALNLGVVRYRQRRFADAGAAFDRAFFRLPCQETGLHRARFAEAQGDVMRVEGLYLLALGLPTRDPRLVFSYARWLVREGRAAEAAQRLRPELVEFRKADLPPGTSMAEHVRMRIRCLVLLEKLASEARQRAEATSLRAELGLVLPGWENAALDPPEAPEVPL